MHFRSAFWTIVGVGMLAGVVTAGEPTTAAEFYKRGSARQKAGKLYEAIADYSEAVRLDPEHVASFNNRGIVWHAMKEDDKAIADYTEAIRVKPTLAPPFENRGHVWRDRGEYDKAVADYTEAIRLDPKSTGALGGRAMVYDALKKHQEALDDYTAFIRLNNTHPGVYCNRGAKYFHLGQYALAISDFQEALRLDPTDKTAATNQQVAIDKLRAIGAKPEVLSVTLDEELKAVRTKSKTYQAAANTELPVEDIVRVKHEVRLAEGWKSEAEVRGTLRAWFAEVQGGVRDGIEKSTSRTYGVESEFKRGAIVRGTGSSQTIRVVWRDLYRTGKAKVKVDGVVIEMPFSFREDFDLITEEVKDEKEKK